MEPNLIVTYDPNHEELAMAEVNALTQVTDFLKSDFSGVFLLHVAEPKKLVKTLTELCEKEPFRFKYTFRWIPADHWCASEEREISELIKKVNAMLNPKESWKLEIAKRGHAMDEKQLLRSLMEHIDKPLVDLKTPQALIKIEVVGPRTAVSLLGSGEYLNTAKKKA